MAKKKTAGMVKAEMKVALAGDINVKPGDHVELDPKVFEVWEAQGMCERAKDDPGFAKAVKVHQDAAKVAKKACDDALRSQKESEEAAREAVAFAAALEWSVRKALKACNAGLESENLEEGKVQIVAALSDLHEILGPDPEPEQENEDEAGAEA